MTFPFLKRKNDQVLAIDLAKDAIFRLERRANLGVFSADAETAVRVQIVKNAKGKK
jgi:hypothetical protein